MKLVSHDGQVLPLLTEPIVRAYVLQSRLSALITVWYPFENRGFVNALVERWHQETLSFHLPIREITITLDDVSCLLHLPMTGRPTDRVPSTFTREVVKVLLMTHLDRGRGYSNDHHRCQGQVDVVGRPISPVCPVRIVRVSCHRLSFALCQQYIFPNKSLTHVHIAYLYPSNLDDCHRYAWGATAQAYLYDYLSYASQYTSKQVGGYMTQSW